MFKIKGTKIQGCCYWDKCKLVNKNGKNLKCSDSNCNAKATIKILVEKNLGFPDPDGNIIEGNLLNITFIYIGHAIFYKYMGYFLNIQKKKFRYLLYWHLVISNLFIKELHFFRITN